MPLNIHENEDVITYARSVTWVTQGSFELSSLDPTATGLLHADKGIRISTNNSEFIISGDDSDPAKTISPFILASVPDSGSIILDGSSGNANNVSLLTVGNKSIQAIGGTALTPTSMLLENDLFETIVGNAAIPAANSKISISSLSIALKCGATSTIEMTPTAIEFVCGLASIKMGPDGIDLKFGVTELSLSALAAKITSLESQIEVNSQKVMSKALTLERSGLLIAKEVHTLLQQNTKAIADIKATLEKKN